MLKLYRLEGPNHGFRRFGRSHGPVVGPLGSAQVNKWADDDGMIMTM